MILPVDRPAGSLEKVEGGLSQVEERVLMERAAGAGAQQTLIWTGEPLSDAQVLEKLKA